MNYTLDLESLDSVGLESAEEVYSLIEKYKDSLEKVLINL